MAKTPRKSTSAPKKTTTKNPKLPPPERKSPWEQPWATFVKLGASLAAGAAAIASLKMLSKRSETAVTAEDED